MMAKKKAFFLAMFFRWGCFGGIRALVVMTGGFEGKEGPLVVPSGRQLSLLRAGVRQQQVLAPFYGGREARLARRMLASSAQERASDPADPAWAEALGRMRRAAFGECSPWIEDRPEWVAALEDAADEIRGELLDDLLLRGDDDDDDDDDEEKPGRWTSANYEAIAPDWRFSSLWRRGHFLQRTRFPKTTAALERATRLGLRMHPFQDVACGFARLPANSEIATHCDGGLVSYNAHLGLVVPNSSKNSNSSRCALTVGGETRPWSEGRCLLFDTSFPHAARNDDVVADRYVLLVQALRPSVRDDEVAPLGRALEVDHPPLGRVHPIYFDRRGRAFATWRTSLTVEGVDDVVVLAAKQHSDGTDLALSASDALLVVDSLHAPTADAVFLETAWRDAPFEDRDFVVHTSSSSSFFQKKKKKKKSDDKKKKKHHKRRRPDLVAVDVRTGLVEWLGFAREDTPAGRFVSKKSLGDEVATLRGQAAYLAHPRTAAMWVPWGEE